MRPYAAIIAVLLSLLVIGVTYLLAFQGPSQPPPAGSGAIAVDANNNVGIGTTSPTVKFDVAGVARTREYLKSDKLGGEGRTGVVLADDAGECSRTIGGKTVKISRALPPTTWEGSAAACPTDWWVCSAADRGTIACGDGTVVQIDRCRPTYHDDSGNIVKGRLNGVNVDQAWVTDAVFSSGAFRGQFINTKGKSMVETELTDCVVYPTWCCAYK